VVWQYDTFILSLIVSGLVSTGLAVVAWQRRAAAGAVPATVLLIAAAGWSFLYALEIVVGDLSIKVILAEASYVAIVLLPAAWLLFTLQFTGDELGRSIRAVGLLAIEPLIVLFLVWSGGLHGILWQHVAVVAAGPFKVVNSTYGPAYWVHAGYSYLVVVVGAARLITSTRDEDRSHRHQTALLVGCGLVPWVGNVLRVVGRGMFLYLDWTPVLFAVAGTGIVSALKRRRLSDIVPVAQDAAFQTLRDGLMVLDPMGRVVRLNAAAESLLGCSGSKALGRPLGALSQELAALLEQSDPAREVRSEVVLSGGGISDTCVVLISPLRDGSSEPMGRLLVMQRIGEQRRMEGLLLEERARLFATLQKAPYGVLLVDQHERCTYANPMFTSITGYLLSDLSGLGDLFREMFPDTEYRRAVTGNWDQDTQHHSLRDLPIKCRDGRVKYVDFRPAMLGDGRALLSISDTTERKRINESLRRSEARYRLMADNIREGLTIIEGGEVVYVNDRACEIFDCSRSALMRLGEFDLAAPEERQRLARVMRQSDQSGQVAQELEFWIVRPDGRRRLVRNRYSAGVREGGVVGKYILTSDITRSRQAEEALRTSEERYRLLAETALDIILIHDAAGHITYINPAGLELVGYAVDELVGRHIARLMPLEYLDAVRGGELERAYAEGRPFLIEATFPTKDRGFIPVEISAVPMDEDTDSSGVLVFARDISERREAEKAQRRRFRELDALFHVGRALSPILDVQQVSVTVLEEVCELLEVTAGSIWLIEPDGRLICREAVGPQNEEVLGWSLEPGEGLAGSVAVSGETLISTDAEADPRHVAEVGHAIGLDLRSIASVPLRARDNVIGVLQVTDTTPNRFNTMDVMFIESLAATAGIAIENARMFGQEEERATELARALAQQRELERLRGAFIQNVSHELRTPLAIALGYSALLDSGDLGELQPDQREPVATISRRLVSLSVMMDDFATVMDLETHALHHESVDLRELVGRYLGDRRKVIEGAGLVLESDVASVPSITGDEINLGRMLSKLVDNGVKFTPAGGTLRVSLAEDDGEVVLAVADTGIGIPPGQLERIFDPFYQVDASMRRRYGGTGLGLSVVRGIVDAHGGSIRVESEEGKGSVFTVRLPVGRSQS